jgi:hypothetical protein
VAIGVTGRREPAAAELRSPGRPSREFQELWFATRRRAWNTLAVVPGAPDASAMPVAQALAEVGQLIHRAPVKVMRVESMDLGEIADLVMGMSGALPPPPVSVWTSTAPGRGTPGGGTGAASGPVILALESVVANPLVLPVALAADAVLLCIELGQTELASARHTVELLGRDRLIGSVLIARR